ncbi:hypothetical protein ONZ45_g11991 [Pleurotus djamor]|nr:hypothetical protein ONZ45_g11991 [Pleurotus djamor]
MKQSFFSLFTLFTPLACFDVDHFKTSVFSVISAFLMSTLFPIFSAHHAANLDALAPIQTKKGKRTAKETMNNETHVTSEAPLPSDRGCELDGAQNGKSSSSQTEDKPRIWISWWFAITAVNIIGQTLYSVYLWWSRSMTLYSVPWTWPYCVVYREILEAIRLRGMDQKVSLFTATQFSIAVADVMETIVKVVYLHLAHRQASPIAGLVGFAAAFMNITKASIFWAQDFCCTPQYRSADVFEFLGQRAPGAFRMIIAIVIAAQFGSDLVRKLRKTN